MRLLYNFGISYVVGFLYIEIIMLVIRKCYIFLLPHWSYKGQEYSYWVVKVIDSFRLRVFRLVKETRPRFRED